MKMSTQAADAFGAAYAHTKTTKEPPPPRRDWRERSAIAAAEIEEILHDRYPTLKPGRDPEGLSLEHALFMAIEMQRSDGCIDSETKACRWLGWLQCMLAFLQVTSLEDEKERNLATGGLAR